MLYKIKGIASYLSKKRTSLFIFLALLSFFIPFTIDSTQKNVKEEISKFEKRVHKRQRILEEYAEKALKTPVDQWLEMDDLPEDMVIYKYNQDTLQSWANEFPISNDEVDVYTTWYGNFFSSTSRNLYYSPLSGINETYTYRNLGSGWYIVKSYRQERVNLITALLVQTQYESQNSLVENKVNEKLHFDRHMSIVPLAQDEGYVIGSIDGEPLFTVIDNLQLRKVRNAISMHWLTILLSVAALISFHSRHRRLYSEIFLCAGLAICYMTAVRFAAIQRFDTEIFSPSLYADDFAFNSLATLLLANLFIFIIAVSLFMMRNRILYNFFNLSKSKKRLTIGITFAVILSLALYINATLISIVNNSSIVLDLFKVTQINIYTIIIYLTYGLLFLSLFIMMQLAAVMIKKEKRYSIFGWKTSAIFVLIISAYTISVISYMGFEKEYERNKIWSNKLAVERDLDLELQLSMMEQKLFTDPILRLLADTRGGSENIKDRLVENYFYQLTRQYDISVSVCGPSDYIKLDEFAPSTNCFKHFHNQISNSGIPLHNSSNIYFINNFNGRVNYLLVVTYFVHNKIFNLFIEIESKKAKEASGYPGLLIDNNYYDNIPMPEYCSYAKYLNGRLTAFKGRYNYPVHIDFDEEPGYYLRREGKNIHFINRLTDNNIIVISHPSRSFIPYLVSFSYIALLFGGIFYTFFKLRKKKPLFDLHRNSFRRRITMLLTVSLVSALICIAAGTSFFIIGQLNESNTMHMEEKLHSTQSALKDYCQYAGVYNDINTMPFFEAMRRVSDNTQVDINLFDPHGRLIRSTQPEIFNRFLTSSRMNSEAYKAIICNNNRQYIHEEEIAGIKYNSLYAPIYNNSGNLITIINIPYFSRNSELTEDASSILAAIINLYILLIIAAIFGGSAVSNSLSRPLAEISKKMKFMDISKKIEHINYKKDDELGVLVTAYNKMADDLEESTRKLAQSEREMAWKDMARQIAHEIKNPLTPMKLSIQYLIRLKEQNVPDWQDRFDKLAASLIEQVDILSDVASEFSSFARFYSEESTLVDLNSLLEDQHVLFDNKDNIKLELRSFVEESYVMVRKSQITRAFVNLITNSIQALENIDGEGHIRITLSKDGDFYSIEFEDNGPGVSEENMDKLFKPNFTTKSSGSGLGLAICRSIIEQSQGKIYYKKSSLGGAEFTILLPIYQKRSSM